MPYKREGDGVFVHKRGRWLLLKKHASVEAAKKHLAALHINVMPHYKGKNKDKE